jgi:signal transduction histidine kinase
LSVVVKDTGIGLTDEEQARLFKRFSQANSRTTKVCTEIVMEAEQEVFTFFLRSMVGQA